jgi:hypothetical protein
MISPSECLFISPLASLATRHARSKADYGFRVAKRFLTRSLRSLRPSHPSPHPLPLPPLTPRGGNPTQAAGIQARSPFPFNDGAPWATGFHACPLLKGR